MDDALRTKAQLGLNILRQRLKAKSLTCHFFNPHSQLYWMFFHVGDFTFPNQMHGPLTHEEQVERLISSIDGERYLADEGQGLKLIKSPGQTAHVIGRVGIVIRDAPPIYSRNTLAGKTFYLREEIKSFIRVALSPQNLSLDQDNRGKTLFEGRNSKSPCDHSATIVIYANYGADVYSKFQDILQESNTRTVFRWLTSLAHQPLLREREAWRLRSTILSFQREFGRVQLHDGSLGAGVAEFPEWSSFFKTIADKAKTLIQPRNWASATICNFCYVTINNEIRVLNSESTIDAERIVQPKGIVQYVARTGQIYLVNDIENYKKDAVARDDPNHFPPYKEPSHALEMKSELACPLIIQKKVVGVLNLECNAREAYGERQVLMLHQFAAAAAGALRQAVLMKLTRTLIKAATDIASAGDAAGIFNQIVNSANRVGFQTAIWDLIELQWVASKDYRGMIGEETPRNSGGFTSLIIKEKKPFAYELEKTVELKTRVYEYNAAEYEWKESTSRTVEVNPGVLRRMAKELKGDSGVRTFLGFPILLQDQMRAVLWTECKCYMMSLLNDDTWFLKQLVKLVEEALTRTR